MLDLTHQTQSFVRHIAPSESITTTLSSSIGHMRHGRALSARVTSPSSSTYSSVVGGACGLSSPSAFCPTSTSSLGREIPLAFADGTHDSVSRCCGGQADHCTKGIVVTCCFGMSELVSDGCHFLRQLMTLAEVIYPCRYDR